MSATLKLGIAVAAAALAAALTIPMLILVLTMPGEHTRQFYSACEHVLGARANVHPDPPQQPPTPDEVLLRIARTAEKLGFGRQGATVTVAIAIRATGLANAANPNNPETLRYAHSALLAGERAGALGLPLAWGTAAELMTPEVSTALVLDRMVNTAPQWRDIDPAELAGQLIGAPAAEFTEPVTTAQARMSAISVAEAQPSESTPAPTPTPTSSPITSSSTTATATALSPAEASSAASAAPEAAACLAAMTTPVPPPATTPNPYGPAIAAAAQQTLGADTAAGAPAPPEPATTPASSSATFVADTIGPVIAKPFPDTIAEQLQTGWRVDDNPEPGDVVFIDISADEGPHLAGIAVDAHTMITTLPGHLTPQQVPIGPNRLIRRIEVDTRS